MLLDGFFKNGSYISIYGVLPTGEYIASLARVIKTNNDGNLIAGTTLGIVNVSANYVDGYCQFFRINSIESISDITDEELKYCKDLPEPIISSTHDKAKRSAVSMMLKCLQQSVILDESCDGLGLNLMTGILVKYNAPDGDNRNYIIVLKNAVVQAFLDDVFGTLHCRDVALLCDVDKVKRLVPELTIPTVKTLSTFSTNLLTNVKQEMATQLFKKYKELKENSLNVL